MRLLIVGFLSLLWVTGAAAQRVPVGDPAEDYERLRDILGPASRSFSIRPAGRRAAVTADTAVPAWQVLHPVAPEPGTSRLRVSMADPALHLYGNSRFPWGQNDGAVWRGRGLTAALEWGAEARWRGVTLVVRPLVVYAENADFALAPDTARPRYSPYAYPYHTPQALRIDMPQRFGAGSLWTLDPGQSSLTLAGSRFIAGAGTENMWWGPARRNAIVMSNNAPGFPHVWVGTSRPLSVGIGTAEVQWIWGRLTESDYFDSTRQRRFITGLVATLQPRPLPGFFVGATRVFVENVPGGGVPLRSYFLVLGGITKRSVSTPSNPFGEDQRDQMLSVFARWVPPASGFEAYVEWARNDHNWDIRDLLMEPEHAQVYTLGVQHAVPLHDGRLLRLEGELTHLERSTSYVLRPNPVFYVHRFVDRGYTQRGQVIGAGIGPGGNAQWLGLDYFTAWGRVGFGLLREVHDNDAFHQKFGSVPVDSVNVLNFKKHHVSAGIVLRGLTVHGAWTLSGELAVLRDYNRHYIYLNDATNVSFATTVRRAWRRPAAR